MKTPANKSRFIPVPSWILSILVAIFAAIILGIINSMGISIGNNTKYVIWEALIAIACFFICWNDPKGVWYVPLLCHILNLLPAILDDTFWTTPFWIIIFIGLCLSFVAAILGAKIGRRAANRDIISKE